MPAPTSTSVLLADAEFKRLRADLGSLAARLGSDHPEVVQQTALLDARRAELRLEEAIAKVLVTRPALTPERRARLAVLLLDGVQDDTSTASVS